MTSTPKPLPADTLALIQRARRGDVESFNQLYRDLAPALYAWASLHVHAELRPRIDPDDLVQECCYRALRGLETYDPDRAPFRSWIFAIANNVLREAARALARLPAGHERIDPGLEIPARTTAITTRMARDESLQGFLQRLQSQPEDDRRLLIYRGLEGLSFEEIGVLVGSSAATVAKRWQRLRDRIQQSPFVLFGD